MTGERGSEPAADPGGRSSANVLRWRAVLVDLAIVAAWVAALSFAWRSLSLPAWAYYAAVFGGIVGYSLLVAPAVEDVAGER